MRPMTPPVFSNANLGNLPSEVDEIIREIIDRSKI